MRKYTHRDFDGDTLTFTAGHSFSLVTIHNHEENYAASVEVTKWKAVEVAQALLAAAGVNAKIFVEEP